VRAAQFWCTYRFGRATSIARRCNSQRVDRRRAGAAYLPAMQSLHSFSVFTGR
jgi:hypothetical protein